MKPLLLMLGLGFCAVSSFAQSDTIKLRNIAERNRTVVTDRPPQAVYFQLGGSGPILSANYDRRFSKKLNGLGFSVGAGFWGGTGVSIFSVPASLNYLVGRRSNFLELAGGATFVTASVDDLFDEGSSTGSGVFTHLNVGYRHQPATGGFFFRGGVSPLFFGGGYVTSYYLGFGYNF